MSSCRQASLRSAFHKVTKIPYSTYQFLGWNLININPSFYAKFYFFVAVFYSGICLIQEFIYLAQNFGSENSFLTLTNCAPCLGFVTLALVKVSSIYRKRKVLKRLVDQFEVFSKENVQIWQKNSFVKTSIRIMKSLKVLYMILIWIFNLMPIFTMIYGWIVDGSYQKKFPYFMWYPFDCFQPVVYEICYVAVMWGAFTCAVCILSTDLMFCAILTFICVRFDFLRSKVRKIIDEKMPRGKLHEWVDDHNEIMTAVDEVEQTFSVSIIINFVGSSLIICLVGFQAFVSDLIMIITVIDFSTFPAQH